MKPLFYCTTIFLIIFSACHKTGSNRNVDRSWQLVEENWTVGPSPLMTAEPSGDSSVLLTLNANNTYSTELNGKVVAQGSFSITTDTSYNNAKVLQLNNFVTTGIFGLTTQTEVGANGQVLSVFDGLFMTLTSDTLTLAGAPTLDGSTAYKFVRK